MGKRIWGVITLLAGLALTVLTAVALAYDIPSNFRVEGKGMEKLVDLVVKYGLRDHILLIGLGIALVLSAFILLLSPRKIKVKTPAVQAAEARDEGTEAPAEATEEEATPQAQPRLICSFRTNLMGTAFANPGGRSRQQILREIRAGDVVACRTVVKRGEEETETVGVFSVKGEQMGIIDVSVLRAIRDRYPNHRIGITVERISGGHGVPYTCAVRLGVYRS
jgi:hypothetical protein